MAFQNVAGFAPIPENAAGAARVLPATGAVVKSSGRGAQSCMRALSEKTALLLRIPVEVSRGSWALIVGTCRRDTVTSTVLTPGKDSTALSPDASSAGVIAGDI